MPDRIRDRAIAWLNSPPTTRTWLVSLAIFTAIVVIAILFPPQP